MIKCDALSLSLPLSGISVRASVWKEHWTSWAALLSQVYLEPVTPVRCFLPCKVKELGWDALLSVFLL